MDPKGTADVFAYVITSKSNKTLIHEVNKVILLLGSSASNNSQVGKFQLDNFPQ